MSDSINDYLNSGNKKTSEMVKKERITECNRKAKEGLLALSRVNLPNAIKHLGRATESWIAYYFSYEQDFITRNISIGTQFPEVNEPDIQINEKNVKKVVMEIFDNFISRAHNPQFYSIIEDCIRTLEVESIRLLTVILSGIQTACESDELISEERQRMVQLCQSGLLVERYNEALKIYCRIVNLLVLHLHPANSTANWSDEAEWKLKEWIDEVKEPWGFIIKELTSKNDLNQSKYWFGKLKERMNVLLDELRLFKTSKGLTIGTKRKLKE